MTPPQPPLAPLTWENLPPTCRQTLTHLLAGLLSQQLLIRKRQTSSPPPQERTLKENNHEQSPQNP
jgi:hypothetical protein